MTKQLAIYLASTHKFCGTLSRGRKISVGSDWLQMFSLSKAKINHLKELLESKIC